MKLSWGLANNEDGIWFKTETASLSYPILQLSTIIIQPHSHIPFVNNVYTILPYVLWKMKQLNTRELTTISQWKISNTVRPCGEKASLQSKTEVCNET